MIGYEGIVKLIRRTGTVASVYADVVYKGEPFTVRSGDKPGIDHEHKLELRGKDENIVAAYAIIHNLQGPPTIVDVPRPEIDKARKASKVKEGGPWQWWYSSMAIKTALLRLRKFVPKTGDPVHLELLARAVEQDRLQFGLADNPKYIEAVETHQQEARVTAAKALPASEDPNRPAGTADKKQLQIDVQAKVRSAGGPTDWDFINGFIRKVAQFALDGRSTLATMADIDAVRLALAQFDLATGEAIPPAAAGSPTIAPGSTSGPSDAPPANGEDDSQGETFPD
jgi:hypothetical protein